MKLYHYTCVENVLAIKERGLLPHLEPMLSSGHVVVWLTTQPDVSVSELDAKAMALVLHIYEAPLDELHRMRAGEIEGFQARQCKQWKYGSMGERWDIPIDGHNRNITFVGDKDDLMRLTVEVPDNDPKLHRFIKWRDRPKSRFIRSFYQLKHVRQWYVYLGEIVPTAMTKVVPMQPIR
jgi:hypothetical protein